MGLQDAVIPASLNDELRAALMHAMAVDDRVPFVHGNLIFVPRRHIPICSACGVRTYGDAVEHYARRPANLQSMSLYAFMQLYV